MDLDQFLMLASVILALVTTAAGAFGFVWVFRGLMPVLDLRVEPRWTDNGFFILRIELTNVSRAATKKKLARLQILEHHFPTNGLLSEWVPFTKDRIRSGEEPIEWHDPWIILDTTEKIEGKECIIVEFLYKPRESVALHCATQFIAQLGPLAWLAYLVSGGTDSWTRTIWAIRPSTSPHIDTEGGPKIAVDNVATQSAPVSPKISRHDDRITGTLDTSPSL